MNPIVLIPARMAAAISRIGNDVPAGAAMYTAWLSEAKNIALSLSGWNTSRTPVANC